MQPISSQMSQPLPSSSNSTSNANTEKPHKKEQKNTEEERQAFLENLVKQVHELNINPKPMNLNRGERYESVGSYRETNVFDEFEQQLLSEEENSNSQNSVESYNTTNVFDEWEQNSNS